MTHPAFTPNRTAVVTGGASGIGLATAERLVAMGLNVCIADHDEEQLGSADWRGHRARPAAGGAHVHARAVG